MDTTHDVVIVGGSVAGLSTALVLGRARWRVAVVDAGHPVNEAVTHSHGFLTRDGASPAELVRRGREEVARYGVELTADEVIGVVREDDGFRVSRAGGEPLVARRLVLATGVRIPLPDLPGLAEVWGDDAATCPFCHGWEVRDRTVALVGDGPNAAHLSQLLTQWTGDVVAFVPESIDMAGPRALGVRVDHRRPVRLVVEGGRLRGVEVEGGEVVSREGLFVAVSPVPSSPLAEELGCILDHDHPVAPGLPVVDPMGATSVPGVWAVGNAVDVSHQLISAAASGSRAAMAITMDLVSERLAAR